jgi:hypothetical protein
MRRTEWKFTVVEDPEAPPVDLEAVARALLALVDATRLDTSIQNKHPKRWSR